ncbi:O-antigen ligase family protein [Hyphomonas johnsonii]|uniref:Putative O-antigen polymerase n=1 Tax=Hyphomonas johnsonii MHS-2 TaxID=1280950 RepID=A0A059FM39_9PROT|nr:O-antigen ligase family protein [Hyphomonas johnsonii]KCZ91571.1 putative O-antigen polymerase [Hyphomonas johnsonii MHS-2]
MTFAPVLAVVFVLWPVMGLLGAQGYGPLLALAGLAALAVARPKMPPANYALMAFAFVAWAALTETWSPASAGLVTGNLLEGNFAIPAASLRVALTALFGAVTVAAALRISQGSAQRASRVMLGAFAVQGLVVAISAYLGGLVLPLIYGDGEMAQSSGVQNIARNANAFVLVLPILAAYLGVRPGLAWKGVAGGLILVSLVVFARIDTQAAMIAIFMMLGAFALVWASPRNGYRWLVSAFAAYIAAAPLLIGAGLNLLRQSGVVLPASFQSRAWSWEIVIGKVADAPLTGQGMMASKTWRETYSDHPDWLARLPDYWASYPVVPGHPHNMPLQVWAETGLVGAVLAGLTLVLVAFHLPRPDTLRPDVRYAIAGLVGVVASLVSVAYNCWNDAFWASVILAVCGIILLSRRDRASL